jgi:hypothetical protein
MSQQNLMEAWMGLRKDELDNLPLWNYIDLDTEILWRSRGGHHRSGFRRKFSGVSQKIVTRL